jgi:hypothetical protein
MTGMGSLLLARAPVWRQDEALEQMSRMEATL